MSIDPFRPADPGAGYHQIHSERRFMYLRQDPDHTLRVIWIKEPVTCPRCETDTGLTLTYEQGLDELVQVLCPARHTWPEPLIEVSHFLTYSRLEYWADPHPDTLWIIDEGFGQEPPPPIEAADITAAAKVVARHARRRAKARLKAMVRRPVRKAKKKAVNLAFTPVAAALRGAWNQQAGGEAPDAPPKNTGKSRAAKGAEKKPKVPPYSQYRKALGIPAPEKGPRCLVCEDTHRITAPGVSIPCTECNPAAEARAAAERRADRARNSAPPAAGGRARSSARQSAARGGEGRGGRGRS